MGGEKHNHSYQQGLEKGSPPRGRGKVVLHCGIVFDVGITPAWAGKSTALWYAVLLIRDHPRVGGEKTKKIP